MAELVGPIGGPLATALDDIDKLPRDDAIGLRAGVQLVVPHEAIWARIRVAVQVDIASDVERCGSVEVGGRVIVDVSELLSSGVSTAILKSAKAKSLTRPLMSITATCAPGKRLAT